MKARSALAALLLMGAILLPAVDSALAQEQENTPEIDASERLTEDKPEGPEPADADEKSDDPAVGVHRNSGFASRVGPTDVILTSTATGIRTSTTNAASRI